MYYQIASAGKQVIIDSYYKVNTENLNTGETITPVIPVPNLPVIPAPVFTPPLVPVPIW